MDAFRFNDKLTCLPQNISSLVVYYNKDLFKEAGVAEPKEGWKWDDMVAAAKKLTKDSNGDGKAEVYGLGIEASIIRVAPFVWSNGGELVDDDEKPTHFTLDTPEAQDALERFLQLHVTDKVTPSDEEVEAEDDETRFQNGRMAMVLSSRRATPTFRTIQDFDWDVAALPAAHGAGGHPPLRRVLPDEGLGEQGRGVELHGVRARSGGCSDRRQVGPHGPVPQVGRRVGCVPRPDGEACELAGLPRHDPGDSPGAEHLDLA